VTGSATVAAGILELDWLMAVAVGSTSSMFGDIGDDDVVGDREVASLCTSLVGIWDSLRNSRQ